MKNIANKTNSKVPLEGGFRGAGLNESQLLIREAIKKIALGRSIDRVNMAPIGTDGIGTARLIHGYVAKIHNDPSDSEFADYGGTIDVGEYTDETSSTEPLIHKGVLLSGTQDNSGGFLIIPALLSDVTIVSDAGTKNMYIVNYSHADIIQLQSHKEVLVGVIETEELDTGDENSPDYDELEPTGNESTTIYTASSAKTMVRDKDDNESSIELTPESILQTAKKTISLEAEEEISNKVDKAEVNISKSKVEQKVDSTGVFVSSSKVTLGEENATEPLVLGNELVQLMMDFMTECTKTMTPTMLGTMPAVNAPNFASLIPKCQKFLSKTSFTK